MIRDKLRALVLQIEASEATEKSPEAISSILKGELFSHCDATRLIIDAASMISHEFLEMARIKHEVVGGGRACLSYENPWRWSGASIEPVSRIRLTRPVRLRCTFRDPLETEKCNWEVAVDTPAWDDVERALGCRVGQLGDPDPQEHEWTPPRACACDVDERLEGCSDGSWFYLAEFAVYLHYPTLPEQPPDGRYRVVAADEIGNLVTVRECNFDGGIAATTLRTLIAEPGMRAAAWRVS